MMVMMRVAAALLCLAAVTTAWAGEPVRTWRVGGAKLRLVEKPFENRLEIVSGGKTVVFENAVIAVDQWIEAPENAPYPAPGTNVTGGGAPQVVVQEYSGGAHCCLTLHVVDLDGPPKITTLPLGDNYGAYLRRHHNGWVAVGNEPLFAYWRSPFVASPAPKVVLQFRDGQWRLAADLMRKPAPSADELERMAAQARESEAWGVPAWDNPRGIAVEAWGPAVDLVYGGNMEAAERYFDMAWHPLYEGKQAFRRDLFECRLRRSGFWPEIAAMNGRPAVPPAADCQDVEDFGEQVKAEFKALRQ
jgi:hypothetical protein